ncbi:DUF1232 domain-containing protein [Myxococcota bacterium]|nr:DUF1232 domain-containing protein [Myxococcota bacterium]
MALRSSSPGSELTPRSARATRGARSLWPLLLQPRKVLRFFRDRRAPLGTKLLVLGVIAYVIMPIDLVPDVAPIVGWLDDAGFVAFALAWFARRLAIYDRSEDTIPDRSAPAIDEQAR